MLRKRHRPAPDGGFTLIELVLAVAVLGIVMTAMSAAMLVAFRSNQETSDRLTSSLDVQFSSAVFADDVAGANHTATDQAAQSGSAACGAGAAVVNFASSDLDTAASVPATPVPDPAPTTRFVSYVVATVSGADGTVQELHRRACKAASPAVFSDTIIARTLSSVGAVQISPAPSRLVSLELTALDGSIYTLQGTRRSSK